jgi:exodeoxyribonuclease-1
LNPPDSFLWHDYETFGAQPMADRPAQFAAQRTDANLNPIGDPLVWYCSPADDVLPHPMACLVTGITPQEARKKGVIETIFAQNILAEMMQAGTCSAGYNSIRFDDAFTRNLLYRNLRDPYAREYKNGNSRWDLIDLTRMYYALRPEGLQWPMHEPGKPSFRLEDLSAANGIAHEGAHDALADVRATIDLARLLREAQPRLFAWALDLRDQKQVAGLLDPVEPKALLHTSSRIPATRGCTSIVLPLVVHPGRPKSVIVFDLMADPTPLIEQPSDVIHDLVFTPSADMPEGVERLPLKAIHTNQLPMVAPRSTLKGVDLDRIRLDPERCRRHEEKLISALATVRHKIAEVFSAPFDDGQDTNDPDRMIYSGGFFSPADRHLMTKILNVPSGDLGGHLWTFQDRRLDLMLFRYRARNYPSTLSIEETGFWERDRKARLIETDDPSYFTLRDFRLAMAEARDQRRDDPEAQRILDQLDAWVLDIGLVDMARDGNAGVSN